MTGKEQNEIDALFSKNTLSQNPFIPLGPFILKVGKGNQLWQNRFDISIENLHTVDWDFPVTPILQSFQTRNVGRMRVLTPRLPQKLKQSY